MTPREQFLAEAAKRILIIDGAFGTEIQQRKLTEADYAGSLGLSKDQKGNMNLRRMAARASLPGQSGRPTKPCRSRPTSTIPDSVRSTGTNWLTSTASRLPRWSKAELISS